MNFVNKKDRAYFIENLSILISSNVNISEALNIIYEGLKSKGFKKKVLLIKKLVDSGSSFWQSLENLKIFSARDISLIKIGESSGRLADNLIILSNQYQKEKFFRSKVLSALMYPSIVLFLVIVIGIGMSWFLLPHLAMIFSQLDIELPFMTKVLIDFGFFVQNYGSIFFPLLITLVILIFYFIFFYHKSKYLGQNFLFNFFITKKLILEAEIGRFGFFLGILLGSGFSIIESLKALEDSTSYHYYKKIYRHLSEKISQGESVKNALMSYRKIDKYIPLPILQIIYVSEKSGKLSESLIRIGEKYEEKLELTTKNLTIALEPFLLIIVWLGVLFLALAIIMPVYNLVGQIN
jgi:type IV pilus assembly protein PilC